MEFDPRFSNPQADSHLAVCVPQTYECGYFLLAQCKRLPFGLELVNSVILGEASGQQVREKFMFRAAFVRGKCSQRSLHAFADLISTRAEFRAQAYQV